VGRIEIVFVAGEQIEELRVNEELLPLGVGGGSLDAAILA
jgi:hypothetical protein